MVPITKDAVFLCGAALFPDEDEGSKIPNVIPSNSYKEQTNKSRPRYTIGQQLKMTRDGHCENITLDSVDVDMSTKVRCLRCVRST